MMTLELRNLLGTKIYMYTPEAENKIKEMETHYACILELVEAVLIHKG